MATIPIRICSGQKSGVRMGFLNEIYTEHMLQAFFKAFDRHGYAVLSRKLGICLNSEKHENYGDWEEKVDAQILAMLVEQAKNPAFKCVTWVYWNHRPLTHQKWVTMLAEAGFNVIERRTLAEINALLAGREPQPTLDMWGATTKQEVEHKHDRRGRPSAHVGAHQGRVGGRETAQVHHRGPAQRVLATRRRFVVIAIHTARNEMKPPS